MRRTNVFLDPKFNEWLYDRLMHINAEQASNLNIYELRMLKSQKHLKSFVSRENLERKLSLLTKLGFNFNLVFHEPQSSLGSLIKKTYRQFTMKGITVESIDEMMQKKVFVQNNRDIALAMAMMSVNCHSEVYVLNAGFTSFRRDLKVLAAGQKKLALAMAANNSNIIYDEVSRSTKALSKTCLQVLQLEDFLSGVMNLRMVDIMILWVLAQTPYNFVGIEAIQRQLRVAHTPSMVASRAAYLFRERNMLEKKPAEEFKPTYIIAAEGILAVGKVNNHIVNSVYGE